MGYVGDKERGSKRMREDEGEKGRRREVDAATQILLAANQQPAEWNDLSQKLQTTQLQR